MFLLINKKIGRSLERNNGNDIMNPMKAIRNSFAETRKERIDEFNKNKHKIKDNINELILLDVLNVFGDAYFIVSFNNEKFSLTHADYIYFKKYGYTEKLIPFFI